MSILDIKNRKEIGMSTVQEALKKTVANKIDTEILSKWIDYNHETGIFTWKLSIGRAKAGKIAGNINRHGYREINFNNKNYLAHRVAYSLVHGDISDKFIDHINGICSTSQTQAAKHERLIMSKKDNVIKSMLSMMDMGAVQGQGSQWYNEAKEALLIDDYKAGLEAASNYLDNINLPHHADAVLEL